MAVASLHYEIVNRRGYRATEVKFSCQADAESYLRDEACHLRTALIDDEVKRAVTLERCRGPRCRVAFERWPPALTPRI
jgi:hypothetical protein